VIVKCASCSFEFTNPRPKKETLSKFYQSASYISHSNKITGPTDIIYRIARFFALRGKLKLINKFYQKGHLLDYGCGTGAFLQTCKNDGWEISGIEVDEKTRLNTQASLQVPILENIEQLEKDQSFDIITLWHVLEHVLDLNQVITHLKNRLSKKGKLIVAVPNNASYDQQLYQEHWAAYDVPRHLYHFDQKTIKQLMKNHQLKLVQTLPMPLDPYYVSLLSEQHLITAGKNKGNKFLNAIVNGYKSNAYAKKNHNNYSSLIYVFEK
jgi:2-polyprenyl-3-methyl-5-hydroxy-6-metoxy-1,4-benzoquinol methylase